MRRLIVVLVLVGVIGSPASAQVLNRCPQYEKLALEVGWKPKEIRQLSKIMWRESRCLHYVVNENKRKDGSVWSRDLGLMQINDYSWRRWLRESGVITADSDLFTPAVNLRAALLIWQYGDSRHGDGWIAWVATSGR